jgi:uncharacterized YccA/Bax inhibitor family protein
MTFLVNLVPANKLTDEKTLTMSLLKSGNPALNDKTFDTARFSDELEGLHYERMTIKGTAGKFGAMMLMLFASATWAWIRIPESPNMIGWLMGSAIAAFIVSLIIIFKRTWAPQLALGYALLEGIVLGALSSLVNAAFAVKYPGIAGQAVLLTFGVAAGMFALYYFRILQATPLFKKVVISAIIGIALFYMFDMILHLFGVSIPFLHDSSPTSIGISLLVVSVASLKLILDFDRIEEGAATGAPRYFEWYLAFGLTLSIVWLYLEILKLLMKLADRK